MLNLSRRWLNMVVREVERRVNRRVAEAAVRRAVAGAGLDMDSLDFLPRDQTVAFVGHVKLTNGTHLAAKAVGWIPLARRADRRKRTNLFAEVDLRNRLPFEAERLAELNEMGCGPHVWVSNDHVTVMDWVDGTPLGEALVKNPDTLHAVIDLVAMLHGKGFYHGDLHSGNVLVGPDGAISLLDPSFRFKDEIGTNERALFDSALLLGSVVAMAPGRLGVGPLVRDAINHMNATQGAETATSMYDFARRYHRENRYLGALLSQEAAVTP